MADQENRPIIIKKIVEDDHDDHHGGAWKVAYADFVTAMMAFFMVLWILSVTEEEVLEGIADYFTPTLVVQPGLGGDGPLDGSTVGEPGTLTSSNSPVSTVAVPNFAKDAQFEVPNDNIPGDNIETMDPKQEVIDIQKEMQEALREKDEETFEELKKKIVQAMNEVPDLRPLIPNVIFDKIEEGLRIQIVDQEGKSMFASGSSLVVGRTKRLMQLVGGALKDLPNSAIISGHTDSVPFANDNGEVGYGNWELSADRANATRRIFITSGVSDDRITRVSGLSDTDPLVPEAPEDATNRRISVVVEYATAPTIETIEQAIVDALDDF